MFDNDEETASDLFFGQFGNDGRTNSAEVLNTFIMTISVNVIGSLGGIFLWEKGTKIEMRIVTFDADDSFPPSDGEK